MALSGSGADLDAHWMRLALAEAIRGVGWVEPNPMVGAAIVRDDRLVSVGHHSRFGGPHAEVVALRAAGDRSRGSTVYVTLEPCCHQGKTPPCTEALIESGVARVVAAIRDPFPRVSGGGFAQLRAAGLQTTVGVEAEAARLQNAPYLKRIITGMPFVTAKWAMTLDGKTATAGGSSQWISGPRSRALVHEQRGRMDGILVGIRTALADDPLLTARPPGPRTPLRILLDAGGRIPVESRLVRTAREVPLLVAVSARAERDRLERLEEQGVEILRFDDPDRIPIRPLLEELGRRGLTNLLVEGGGRVLGSFLDAGQVDAVDVFIAARIEGGPPEHTPVLGRGVASMTDALRLESVEVSLVDGDIRLRGIIPRRWRDDVAGCT